MRPPARLRVLETLNSASTRTIQARNHTERVLTIVRVLSLVTKPALKEARPPHNSSRRHIIGAPRKFHQKLDVRVKFDRKSHMWGLVTVLRIGQTIQL